MQIQNGSSGLEEVLHCSQYVFFRSSFDGLELKPLGSIKLRKKLFIEATLKKIYEEDAANNAEL